MRAMRGRRLRLLTFGALALVGAALAISPALAQQGGGDPAPGGIAYSIELQATIDPATERWISSALDDAASEDAAIAIIRLDTPGGLSDSMRSIIQDMAAAPIPVVVYVSPNGARAASAGAYITEAADVAAMAPETNIGSATPIAVGPDGGSSDLDRKIKNDAAASMRALASIHGRNPRLANELVTKAKNLTAEEAEKAGLIDLIASDQEALVAQLDGFQVKGPKAQTLHTAGLRIEDHDMPLQYELLEILVNPNVAYLLILIGLMGLTIELFSPGLIAPGTIGLISLLLGLYGTAQLPVTATGVLLLRLRGGDDHRRGAPPDSRHPGRLRGGGADRRRPGPLRHQHERLRDLGPGRDPHRAPDRRLPRRRSPAGDSRPSVSRRAPAGRR